ncbi:MAG: hypothetical protein IKH06_05575 [Clostridiales bacterium]|nr:hypothetical protein [Clostridiales bacterium]
MKLSEILFSKTKELWDQSAKKPFVIEMAKGTLDKELFKRYMLQDYLYLQEYIGILKSIRDIAEDEETKAFLGRIVDGTAREIESVHMHNMEELGITKDDIEKSRMFPVILEYNGYMKKCVEEFGLIGGLAALLQCSWVYAYIADVSVRNFKDEIAGSEYRSWFEAYTCQSYLDTNRMWIDLLDEQSSGIDDAKTAEMCKIFERCAHFENEFWDALYT